LRVYAKLVEVTWFGYGCGKVKTGGWVVATKQPANFGRAYAAYGGVFIILSIIWGWKVDGFAPDKLDLVGAGIIFTGVLVMMYAPR
jgi:small multidrug resistance family-3 protein